MKHHFAFIATILWACISPTVLLAQNRGLSAGGAGVGQASAQMRNSNVDQGSPQGDGFGQAGRTRAAALPRNPQSAFAQNALRFDLNGDQQLAANELSSLFGVSLAQSRQIRQKRFPPLRPGGIATQAVSTQIVQSAGPTIPRQQIGFLQRQDVRDAAGLFLLLALQFDLNGDGMLNVAELRLLASALQQTGGNQRSTGVRYSSVPATSQVITTQRRYSSQRSYSSRGSGQFIGAGAPIRFGSNQPNVVVGSITRPAPRIGGSQRPRSGLGAATGPGGSGPSAPPNTAPVESSSPGRFGNPHP